MSRKTLTPNMPPGCLTYGMCPLKDSENWQLASIRIYSREEVDNSQLYTLSFIE
ncbi:MAG: hypothetical protein LBC47_07570 [Tannerella sp.]|nr:hypothetical protein [Tannerella sp.]